MTYRIFRQWLIKIKNWKKNALKNARTKQVLIITILYGYLTAAIIHNDDDDDEVDKVESDYGDVGQPSSSANIRSARTYAYINMYVVISKSYIRYLLVLHLTRAIRQTSHESLRECAYTNASALVRVGIPVASVLHIIAYVIISAISTHIYIYVYSVLIFIPYLEITRVYTRQFSIYLYLCPNVTLDLSYWSYVCVLIIYMCMWRCVVLAYRAFALACSCHPHSRGHAFRGTRMHIHACTYAHRPHTHASISHSHLHNNNHMTITIIIIMMIITPRR